MASIHVQPTADPFPGIGGVLRDLLAGGAGDATSTTSVRARRPRRRFAGAPVPDVPLLALTAAEVDRAVRDALR